MIQVRSDTGRMHNAIRGRNAVVTVLYPLRVEAGSTRVAFDQDGVVLARLIRISGR